MKKLSALLLSLLLLLTACGTPAMPDDAVTPPTPNDEILVEEGLRAEDLPEVCRLWFDLAETSGAADKNSKLPLASRADEGACDYLAVRLPDGTYTDLIQEGSLPMRASRLPISPVAGRSRRAPTVSSRGMASCTTPSPSPRRTAPSRTSLRRTAASSV